MQNKVFILLQNSLIFFNDKEENQIINITPNNMENVILLQNITQTPQTAPFLKGPLKLTKQK